MSKVPLTEQEVKDEAERRQKKYFKMLMDEPEAVVGNCALTRHVPYPRTFQCPLHMFKFDCRYPPSASQSFGSYFLRSDFFGDQAKSLDACVREEIKTRLSIDLVGRIDVVCNLRILGCGYNPFIPYFCHDEFEHLVALLVEVRNLPWGESHVYAMRVGEPGSMRHNPSLAPSTDLQFFPADPAENNKNRERAIREKSFSTLVPALHQKALHMSPFSPSPQQELWYYHFKLRGKTHLTVEAYKPKPVELPNGQGEEIPDEDRWSPESDQRQFSATWDFSMEQEHDICTGSIRSLWNVYMQMLRMYFFRTPKPSTAFALNAKKASRSQKDPVLSIAGTIMQGIGLRGNVYPIYAYQPPKTPITSFRLWSWLLLILPAGYLIIGRERCSSALPSDGHTAIALAGTAAIMAISVHSSGTYFLLKWLAGLIGSFAAFQYFMSLAWMDLNMLFVFSCIAQVLCWLVSGDTLPTALLSMVLATVCTIVAVRREECSYPFA
jgi:hypothetical protein